MNEYKYFYRDNFLSIRESIYLNASGFFKRQQLVRYTNMFQGSLSYYAVKFLICQ